MMFVQDAKFIWVRLIQGYTQDKIAGIMSSIRSQVVQQGVTHVEPHAI